MKVKKHEGSGARVKAGNCMAGKKRISCVIVNYNDPGTTEKLVRRIFSYSGLDGIVVVDNRSTDDSLARLEELIKELNGEWERNKPTGKSAGQSRVRNAWNADVDTDKQKAAFSRIALLEAKRNGGYGAGNNLGISYALREQDADYVLIANPDVEFSERLVLRLARLLENHPELGAVSAVMEDPVYGRQKNGWPVHGLLGSLARSGPVCRRLFGRFLEYGDGYISGKRAVYVDALHGSLLMADGKKMKECGGYDERVFLYHEEEILGTRLKDRGYKSALLLTDCYVHRHSQSISRTYQDVWQRQKLRNRSAMYYYRKYLKINGIQELAVRGFFQIVRLEIWFCSQVLGMDW